MEMDIMLKNIMKFDLLNSERLAQRMFKLRKAGGKRWQVSPMVLCIQYLFGGMLILLMLFFILVSVVAFLAFFRGETAYCDVGFNVSLAMCHAMGYRLWIAKFRFFPIVLLLLDIIWAILIVI